jgi:hypothetical protein
MMARQAGIDALALVIKYTPNPQPFGLGESFVRAFTSAVIPRQLWRGKPIFNPSREFEQNYLGMPGFYEGHTSMQVLADLYANFWLAGVTGGMLLFGVFLRWLNLFCAPGPNSPAGLLFYALLLPPLAHMMEATVGVMELEFVRLVLFVVLGAALFGVRINKIQQRRSSILLPTSRLENVPVSQGH